MGRSRLTPERESELFEVVLDLLREVGYESLTMDAVATRARSSKATLYRQWHSKPELVATALQQAQTPAEEIDTGSLRGDFEAILMAADDAQMKKDSALYMGLVHAVHANPDLHDALVRKLIEPESRALKRVLDRAVVRGEIRPDNPALNFLPHMLFGAFFILHIIENRVPDRDFLARYVHAVVLPALEAR
ncbi:TetR/AcrR family transcriptional regulator [Streptomyces sp. NPDC004838]